MFKLVIRSFFMMCVLATGAAWAQTYTLYTEKHCANRTIELTFKCKPTGSATSPSKIVISKEGPGQWLGEERGQAFPLNLIKEDQHILILDYPVLYSGTAHVVLMKKTGRFYFTEIAYSPVLEEQGYDIESGRFELKKNNL